MRPIDGDFIDKKLDEIAEGSDGVGSLAFMILRSWLRTLPTLTLGDLRPRGRWIERYGVSEYKYECSLCHLGSDLMTDFCPSCGADMRGGGEDA